MYLIRRLQKCHSVKPFLEINVTEETEISGQNVKAIVQRPSVGPQRYTLVYIES